MIITGDLTTGIQCDRYNPEHRGVRSKVDVPNTGQFPDSQNKQE